MIADGIGLAVIKTTAHLKFGTVTNSKWTVILVAAGSIPPATIHPPPLLLQGSKLKQNATSEIHDFFKAFRLNSAADHFSPLSKIT